MRFDAPCIFVTLIASLILVGCADDAPRILSEADVVSTDEGEERTIPDSAVAVDTEEDTASEDIAAPSWCESFCTALDDGCPEGQDFSEKDCLSECVASSVGECADAWKATEACIEFPSEWSCGGAGHAAPADASCTQELGTLRDCLGPPDPCDPPPCGAHETCILDAEGDAYCSSDAEEWCTAITMGMKETCPDYLKNPSMHIALCIQNAQGPCALECAIVRDCVPGDAEWICDPAQGVLPKDGACMEELMNMQDCTMANGSVP